MISFAKPLFLALSAFLILPVLIHLIRRQNALNIVFPSISWILRGKLPREGRRKLRDIFLLLLRLLLFSAVILALSEPVLNKIAAEQGKQKSQIALIMDSSSSMSGWNSLDNLQSAVSELVKKNPDAEFFLIRSADSPECLLSSSKSKGEIMKTADSLKASEFRGNHAKAFEKALELFDRDASKKIVVLSDFQRSDWDFPDEFRIPAEIPVEFLDVGSNMKENVGIVSASRSLNDDGSSELILELKNYGEKIQKRNIAVKTLLEEKKSAIEILPGKTARASFRLDKGEHGKILAQTDCDEYQKDDSFHIWLDAPKARKIYVFIPSEREPERADDALFIQKAFQTRNEAESANFEVFVFDVEEFSNVIFDDATLIFLCGACAYLKEEDFSMLRACMKNGIPIVATPGRASGNSFSVLSREKLLSTEYQGFFNSLKAREYMRISPKMQNSFIKELFGGSANADLFLFPIYRYVKLVPKAPAETLLSTLDQYPFLLRQQNGEAAIFAFSLDFNLAWSEFPISGSFVPIMREIAGSRKKNLGGAVAAFSCGDKVPDSLKNVFPDGKAAMPGVYETGEENAIQVNAPESESIPEKQSLFVLREKLCSKTANSKTAGANLQSGESGRSFFDILAILALAALIFESILALLLESREELRNSLKQDTANA